MRRIIAVVFTSALLAGLMIGVSQTATASTNLGTVTVSGTNPAISVSPTVLDAQVGDTFTLNNTSDRDVSIRGSVSRTIRDPRNCETSGSPWCVRVAGGSDTFIVDQLGSFTITIYTGGGFGAVVGTVTLGSRGGSSESARTPQVTMTFDGNGGNCSTNPLVITGAGGAAYQLPAEGSGAGQCRRDDYTLLGWSHEQGATSVDPNLGPGATVNFANAGGTMYAVWSPVGVEVVYDANVGAADQCTRGRSNVVGDARQSAPVVLQEGRDGGVAATQAPCTPYGFPVPIFQLAGWALTGDGPSVVAPGAALPASFTSGSSYVLYAKWQVVFGLTFSTDSLSMAPDQQATVTITATLNGAPAANAVVGLEVAPAGQFGLGSVLPLVVTDAAGQARVTVVSSANLTAASPPTTLTAAFGNTTASVQLTPAEAVKRRIVIAGKRSTVSGLTVIRISGGTSGFAAGDRVVPLIRFLGSTRYFEGSTRPEVGADGSFYWRSEAGQDLNVYFTSEDGSVRSNALNFLPAR